MKRWLGLLSFLLFLTLACGALPVGEPDPTPTIALATLPVEGEIEPGDYWLAVMSSGQQRTFKLHLPPGYTGAAPFPLIINMHGYGSYAEGQEWYSQMTPRADQEGFIVVYPQAAGNPAEWNLKAEHNPDLDFMRAMIAELQARLNVDPKRIFATGISNGGGMANRMGCSMADVIAAIAPVSGGYWNWEDCASTRPLPVLSFHGDADGIVPFEGFDAGGENLPEIETWAQTWAERNGCEMTPQEVYNFGVVTGEAWGNCAADATVTLYIISGGGHTWPGSVDGTQDIAATDVILNFFEQHPMP